MDKKFYRTELLIGKENIEKLSKMKIAIFGIGGVGSYVAEGLARMGIGNFVLIDSDKVEETNINRQIIATTKTIGEYKVDVMKKRILDINPKANIITHKIFFDLNSKELILDDSINYIIDAIDTITSKIYLIEQSKKLDIPIISSMGTGNKLDPTKFEITDIYKTSVCPLAKVMRKELKKRNIKDVKVLYSKEEPIKIEKTVGLENKKIIGSVSFVPSVAGLTIVGEVIKEVI